MLHPETALPDEVLAREIEPVVEKLYDRHLENARQWYPHQLTPWSKGKDYVPGEAWDPEAYPLPNGVRSAIFVNLLTEDNLPYYFNTINSMSNQEVWRAWTKRWTAEEDRHSTVIRNWVEIMQPIDPKQLEDARMIQVSTGQVPHPPNLMEGIAYVSFQELATQVAHRNTGWHLLDEDGKKIMGRVAGDETLHHRFYRDLGAALFKIDPSAMMVAVDKQIRGFAMPGTGIPNFKEHTVAIAKEGIYDAPQFKAKVVEPTLEHWGITTIADSDLNDAGLRARDRIDKRLQALGRSSLVLQSKS